LLVLLISGLALPSLFSLVNDEIGARAKGPRGRLAAIIALAGVCFTWGLRDYEHRRAVNALDARLYKEAEPLRVSAFPAILNPFQWYGLVETNNFFATMPVDSLAPDVDPQGQMRIRFKPEETPVTLVAKKSYLGRVYLDWAQYPITETDQLESGYLVRFRDLRFEYGLGEGRNPLGAGVELNSSLQVVREFMGTRSRLVSDSGRISKPPR
jgi:inner membrane protein